MLQALWIAFYKTVATKKTIEREVLLLEYGIDHP
jgi:hypothetical protein